MLTMQPAWHWAKTDFRAMNTDIYAWLYSPAENSQAILYDVAVMFQAMDNRLSRFQPDSELSALNRSGKPFVASHTLFAVLEAASWAAEVSGGIFEPAILPALERAGYDRTFERVAKAGPAWSIDQCPRSMVGRFKQITLNPVRRLVDKPAGMKIDLGGIGKGWAVDCAANRLAGLGPFLLNAGGDLYAYGTPPGASGWPVTLAHPHADDLVLAKLRLKDRAVATSSLARRQWRRGEQLLHHLIDPRCGRPAETDLLAVTVIADRVYQAEVLAKTALIMGAETGLDYLQSLSRVEGLLLTKAGQVRQTSGLTAYFT